MKLRDLFEVKVLSLAYAGNHKEVQNYSGGSLDLSNKSLNSLKGCPEHVTGNFICAYSTLPTLKDGPKKVDGNYICYNNELRTLEGAAEYVGKAFICHANQLTSLDGLPSHIGDGLYCQDNQLTSFKGIHNQIKELRGPIVALGNPVKSHVLGLLLVKGISSITFDNTQVCEILNKQLGKGRAGMLQAQEELIEAGLEEFAQL